MISLEYKDSKFFDNRATNKLEILVRLGQTLLLQKVYGDITISRTRVFEWDKSFKEGCGEVKDDLRSRRPSISRTEVNFEQVKQLMCGDRSNNRKSAEHEKDSVWKFITEDLGMLKVYAEIGAKTTE